MIPNDRLTPIPGRLHFNANAGHPLGDELYVAITGIGEHGSVSVMAQNISLGTTATLVCVSECVLRDP